MAEITQTNGRPNINYMARDYESLLASMHALIPYKLPEWTNYESEADFGNVLLELFAHMGDLLNYYQDRVANESFLTTAQTRRNIIQHLKLIGYQMATAAPASAMLTVKVAPDCNDTIIISKGDAFATESKDDSPSVRFEYTRENPLKIDFSKIPVIYESKSYSKVPVEEGQLVEKEYLGKSEGIPNQKFPLAHLGIILKNIPPEQQSATKDIILLIQLGEVIEEWHFKKTLAFSRKFDQDFTIEVDENDQATIIFGDGLYGAIPPCEGTIEITYRVGGGSVGNVDVNSIKTIEDAPQLTLLGAEVTNLKPATGGAERESINHAVMQAPVLFRSQRRAVTASDYEALAINFPGVGKAKSQYASWNRVTLYIAPTGGGQVSDVLRANLLTYFEDKRPITTHIKIADVKYVTIYISSRIQVQDHYDPDDVKSKVQQTLAAQLAFENVSFGQTIYVSEFLQLIWDIDGIKFAKVGASTYKGEELLQMATCSEGEIHLGIYELPVLPADDPDYPGGVRVIVEE